MFQTHSFEAFNTSSHANLKCSLKYSPSNSSLSSLTVEYFFGITQKRHLTISESTLSYDIHFVLGNLKGFYEYLRSIHEESKFEHCEFTKDEMKVSFLLKVFHQDKTIRQDFKSSPVNDQVIWKSELKSKLQNMQFTMSNRMEKEIDRKVRHCMSEQKQRSFMKVQAIEEKVSRELSLMKDKLDLVVKFINSQESVQEKLQFNEVRYRGRYNEEKEQKSSYSFSNENDERRMTRSNDLSRKNKQIQKDEKPPQQAKDRKSTKNLKELKKIANHDRSYQIQREKHERAPAAQKIEEWERQYERLNIPSIQKVYPIFEKIQNNSFMNRSTLNEVQKKSRGRPRVFRQNNFATQHLSPSVQEPFIIEKFRNVKQNQLIQLTSRNIGHKLRERSATIINVPSLSEEKRIKLSRERAENQMRNRRTSQEVKSKSIEIDTDKITKGQQVAKSLQQALKSYEPSKNQDQRITQSTMKNNQQSEKMIDEKSEKLDKKSLEKKENKQNSQEKRRKLSQEPQPVTQSVNGQKLQQQSSLFRRNVYQKNSKPQEFIDLEDEEEYKNFIIKISSKKVPQRQESVQKMDEEVMKVEEEEINNVKKRSEVRKQRNSPIKQQQIFPKKTKQIFVSFHTDSMQNHVSDSEMELNEVDRLIQNFKKSKIEQKKNQYESKIQIPTELSHQKSPQRLIEPNDANASQNNQNIKNFTTPNSKVSFHSMQDMVDPERQIDISQIPPAKVPTYEFLSSVNHIIPDFTPNQSLIKINNVKLENYFEFIKSKNQRITKISKLSVRGKNRYIPLISKEPFPQCGKQFWCIRILRSGNYHICMGIVDMPSEIKLGQIPKNCDALYVLDGGLHDEKGGDKNQNGWRVKEGPPVDVLQMELQVEKKEMYVIMVVDMDKEEMSFYYNDRLISSTQFSTWCRKNKKRLHAYLAMRTDKDCIEVV